MFNAYKLGKVTYYISTKLMAISHTKYKYNFDVTVFFTEKPFAMMLTAYFFVVG